MHFEPRPTYYDLPPPGDRVGRVYSPRFAQYDLPPPAQQYVAPGLQGQRSPPPGSRGFAAGDDPPGGGGFFEPTPAAQKAFEDYKLRWLLMSTWQTVLPATGKVLTFWQFPQFTTRFNFWLPWATAWERGTVPVGPGSNEWGAKDVTQLVAQRSNLNGAELDAQFENRAMSAENLEVTKANAAGRRPKWNPTGTFPYMQLIPLVDGPSLDAPGVESSTPALAAAAAVDQLAKDAAKHVREALETAEPIGWALGFLGLGLAAFLLARAR